MRKVLIFAAIMLVGSVYLARYADNSVVGHPATQAAAVQPAEQPTHESIGQHKMELTSGRDGHFRVDTGASVVTLRETSASMVGVHPMPRDYTASVATANGKIKAAPTKLSRIEIGDITVFDVPALVLPDEALSTNLLGVSFLSRLRRYEYADGRMIFEQ